MRPQAVQDALVVEWALRSCQLAVRLGEALGMNVRDCQDAYYLSSLRHIGCTATASGDAALFGDELTVAYCLCCLRTLAAPWPRRELRCCASLLGLAILPQMIDHYFCICTHTA